jgi:hypothetical protein
LFRSREQMRASNKDASGPGTARETASHTITINHGRLYTNRNWVTPYRWTCVVRWFTMGKYFRITAGPTWLAFLTGHFFLIHLHKQKILRHVKLEVSFLQGAHICAYFCTSIFNLKCARAIVRIKGHALGTFFHFSGWRFQIVWRYSLDVQNTRVWLESN